jgi:hypothetical protein
VARTQTIKIRMSIKKLEYLGIKRKRKMEEIFAIESLVSKEYLKGVPKIKRHTEFES